MYEMISFEMEQLKLQMYLYEVLNSMDKRLQKLELLDGVKEFVDEPIKEEQVEAAIEVAVADAVEAKKVDVKVDVKPVEEVLTPVDGVN